MHSSHAPRSGGLVHAPSIPKCLIQAGAGEAEKASGEARSDGVPALHWTL